MKKVLINLALFLLCSPVVAQVPVSEYYENSDEPFMVSYIWGVSSGMLALSAIRNQNSGHRTFCIPEERVITNSESIAIFEAELTDGLGLKKHPEDTPISVVFLMALESRFPCR
ncbi:hypothetical protein [Microbulbifer agarilyticus]|uniref:hypothetical protein n=1 Tax=Microbulbifer agarilyticus TaxID=260552 RepID=UPI001CD55206|nr:hypothetical protein [Microbulbifer agarilyticus]MCA0895133.1 hypothetical protein [Microbulbifer agarilyticus]